MSVKLPALKSDTLSIGQLQDSACGVVHQKLRTNEQLPNSSAPSMKLACA